MAKSPLSGGGSCAAKRLTERKYGNANRGKNFLVIENNFSKSSCRNPDNRKNPENRNRLGNYGQLEKRIKLRRSYWRFLVLDRVKGVLPEEVVESWWINEGRRTLFVLRKVT